MSGDAAFWARFDERVAPIGETLAYASRVVARMPSSTHEQRIARAERYMGILHEWHLSRIRWKITRP